MHIRVNHICRNDGLLRHTWNGRSPSCRNWRRRNCTCRRNRTGLEKRIVRPPCRRWVGGSKPSEQARPFSTTSIRSARIESKAAIAMLSGELKTCYDFYVPFDDEAERILASCIFAPRFLNLLSRLTSSLEPCIFQFETFLRRVAD